jgi:hypothetical protein
MRLRRRGFLIGLALACAFALSGCIKYDMTILVKPDGSGEVHEVSQFNLALAEQMMSGMMGAVPGAAGEKPKLENQGKPWADQARERAAQFGPGVRLLDATEEKKEGWLVQNAVYAFDDVTKLQPSDERSAADAKSAEAAVAGGHVPVQVAARFALNRAADGTSELVMTMPPPEQAPPEKAPEATETPPAMDAASAEMAKQFVQQMFKGFEMRLAVQCAGQVLETNATYCENGRITLVHVSFDDLMKLLDDPAKMAALNALGPKPASPEEARELLKQVPGVQMELQPEVRVKFKP